MFYILASFEIKKRRQRVIFIKISFFFAFVFILGGAIYVSCISINIKTVTITGNKFIETEAIKRR